MRQWRQFFPILLCCAVAVAAVLIWYPPELPPKPIVPAESTPPTLRQPAKSEIPGDVATEQRVPEIFETIPPDPNSLSLITAPAELAAPTIPPQLLYALYLADAQDGDPEAQYMVSLALSQCLVGLRTPEQMEQIMKNPGIHERAKEVMHQRYKDCQPVAQQLEGKNPAKERQRWQKAAVDAGYPLAVLQYQGLRRTPDAPDTEVVKLLLARAFNDSAGKPILETQAASLVGRYLTLHEPWRRDDITAWRMVGCELNPACNRAIIETYMKQAYRDHEYENIRQTADSYLAAFQERRWEDLGLDLPLFAGDPQW